MLENLVDVLIKKIREEVISDPNMQDIPLAYLTTRNIPDSVKHFLDQEVELWIRDEEEKFSFCCGGSPRAAPLLPQRCESRRPGQYSTR